MTFNFEHIYKIINFADVCNSLVYITVWVFQTMNMHWYFDLI